MKALCALFLLMYYFGFIMFYALVIYLTIGDHVVGHETVFQIVSVLAGALSGTAVFLYLLKN